MTAVGARIQKKRGRGRPFKPGGRDLVVAVRLPGQTIVNIDQWAAREGFALRSKAVRLLIELGLGAVPPKLPRIVATRDGKSQTEAAPPRPAEGAHASKQVASTKTGATGKTRQRRS